MINSAHAHVLASALAATCLAGCATNLDYADQQGLKQVSTNVYEVFREDHRGVFGSEGSLQDRVVSDANKFAEQQGMSAEPIEAKQHRVGILGDWGWAYYKFKLAPKTEKMVSANVSEIAFVGDARMSNNFLATKDADTPKMVPQSSGVYEELLKLDELRKKGILTEEEFQSQKKRLLEQQN